MAIILFTITSCQKDDAPLETAQEGPQFEVEKLTGSQLTSNRSLNKALLEAKANLSITSAQKSFYDSINGFWIDDSKVNHLSSGDYESFTYAVYKNGDSLNNKIYNLMLAKQADSTYKSTLITLHYDYDVNLITDLGIYASMTLSEINTAFEKNLSGDIPWCNINSNDCDCNVKDDVTIYLDGTHVVNSWHYRPCAANSIDQGDSIGSGSNPSDDGDTGSGGNDNTPGGNNQNNPDTSGDQYNTNPNTGSPGTGTPTDDPCDGMLMSDGSCGNAVALDVRLVREIINDQLDDLLGDGESWSDDESGTLDDTNTLQFDNFEEFKAFREEFLNNFPTPEGTSTTSTLPNGKIRVVASTDFTAISTITVGLDLNLDDPSTPLINETSVENVNSSLSGGDIFLEYIHNDNQETLDSSSYDSFNVLEVRGDVKLFLLIGGFIKLWTIDVRTTMLLDNLDGSVRSMYTEIQF